MRLFYIFSRGFYSGLLMVGIFFPVGAQEFKRIYEIQGNTKISPYAGQRIKTEGVVTYCLFKSDQLGVFFIQDTLGDGNFSTSDAICVEGRANVKSGDYISLTAKVEEQNGVSRLTEYEGLQTHLSALSLPISNLHFPSDFSEMEALEAMLIRIEHPMILTSTYYLEKYGQITLSSQRLRAPTDIALPRSEEALSIEERNKADQLIVDDGSANTYPKPIPFLDKNETCRTGSLVPDFLCVIDQMTTSLYVAYPVQDTAILYAERLPKPEFANDDNLLIGGLNLEFFQDKSEIQKKKLIKTLAAMEADLLGLCEVNEGRAYIKTLCDGLNKELGHDVYDYIDPGSGTSTYLTTQILYKKDKLRPYKDRLVINHAGPLNRKIIQAFDMPEYNYRFLVSVNHFKAKSGNGSAGDADQGDGQGSFNETRVKEANALVARLSEAKYYYEASDIIILGDLNAFSMEDPLRIIEGAGYAHQLKRFSPDSYTYVYGGNVEYLDYALCNGTMAEKVKEAKVWHINADEPDFLSWEKKPQDNIYRCSDHDPIMISLKIPKNSLTQETKSPRMLLWPNPVQETLFFRTNFPAEQVEVYNLQGRRVLHRSEASESALDVQALSPGVYLLKVSTNKEILTVKFIKK